MVDLSWGQPMSGALAPPALSDTPVLPDQGSEEWHRWRGKGIGSSDAAILLGWSPWRTIGQLYEEKLGLWKPDFGPRQMAAMKRGKDLEPKIRHWYEQNIRGGKLFPDGVAQGAGQYGYLRASFDGINHEFVNPEDQSVGRIVEIKAPNRDDHALAKEFQVPEKYIPQVQWLMMVAEIPWCDYVSYGSDGSYAIVPVKADPKLQSELALRASVFWRHIETKTPILEWERHEVQIPSPMPLSLDHEPLTDAGASPTIADQEVEAIVAQAIEAQGELDRAQARFDELKGKLKGILGSQDEMRCGEALFGWQTRKGQVDYSVIPELIGIDLDQFRKPPTRAFYLKRVDSKS